MLQLLAVALFNCSAHMNLTTQDQVLSFQAPDANLEGSLQFALFRISLSDVVGEAYMFEMGRGWFFNLPLIIC